MGIACLPGADAADACARLSICSRRDEDASKQCFSPMRKCDRRTGMAFRPLERRFGIPKTQEQSVPHGLKLCRSSDTADVEHASNASCGGPRLSNAHCCNAGERHADAVALGFRVSGIFTSTTRVGWVGSPLTASGVSRTSRRRHAVRFSSSAAH